MSDLPPTLAHDQLAPSREEQLLRRVSTSMFDIVDEVSPIIARQMIKRVPALGPVDDETAFEATRRSALGSMYELLCITRAGLNAPGVIETSPEALEHLRFLRQRGSGFDNVLGFYRIGLAMFEPLMGVELARLADDATAQAMAAPMRAFIFTYVDQVTRRLAAEFGVEREDWNPDPSDPGWHDPDTVEVIRAFVASRAADWHARPETGAAARRYTQAAVDRFATAMATAALDERMSTVLSRANTTVRIVLADDPELSVGLLLDRQPIEVTDGTAAAEVEMSIVSVDLSRLYSPDFHLSMAIHRGRVGYRGPVRKFLRVTPVVRHASLSSLSNIVMPVSAA